MSKNNDFKIACEQWIQAALRLLANKPMPYEEDIEVTFSENGYQTRGGNFKIDVGRLSITYHDELVSLPEYRNVEHIVLNTPSLASVLCIDAAGVLHTQESIQKNLAGRYLIGLLLHYLATAQDFTFKAETFEAAYEMLEHYIYSEHFEGVWLVNLRNLTFAVDAIRLDHKVVLRPATIEEKEQAIKERLRIPLLVVNSDVPNAFLEIRHAIDRIAPPDTQEAMSIAQAAVLALRLLKDNPIGLTSYRWYVHDQPYRPNQGFTQSPLLVTGAFSGEPYVLTQEDAAILPKAYKKAKRAYQNSELTTAITRFEDSYTRLKLEDKLLDYWVALEALFFSLIPKEFVGSMGETVASNIAYYIGSNESERRSIYAFIYSSHKARGYFVHGQRGTRPENLDLIIKKTEQYL